MRSQAIPRNTIEFSLRGRYALFTDPLTKVGGEKCSYHVPTYEALKGVVKSIYWKPTLIWFIDELRIMKRIRTQTKGVKPRVYGGGNDLAIYTFLADVEYQVRAHFEWNLHRPELAKDRIDGKHRAIALRSLERGGRQDIFLGIRDCQGYVEPCVFGEGDGALDHDGELAFGVMFHGFDYPDEIGVPEFRARFWRPVMCDGHIRFPRPEKCDEPKLLRSMTCKPFGLGSNVLDVDVEAAALGVGA
ncbi:CRISPR-associated protein Cas5d [Paraburkholderia sp. WC7.3g]|uniref:type I-C CRISPR-associated protein Cas5c n=1 Tax=Paraburkholderia sp. WC7.3g TaxID=2991070 RepID=UPI003D1D2508